MNGFQKKISMGYEHMELNVKLQISPIFQFDRVTDGRIRGLQGVKLKSNKVTYQKQFGLTKNGET